MEHLLVPLDGSQLAEAALPAAAALARDAHARVTLLHVVERNAPSDVHGQRHLKGLEEARAYLAGRAREAFGPEARVACRVDEQGAAGLAQTLAEGAAALRPDLIVMCTHGRTGLRGLLFGSVAQQVVARGLTPVLLIRPRPEGTAPPFACRQMLVPDDGTAGHEPGLAPALELARACGAAIHLVMAVETLRTLGGPSAQAGSLMPGAAQALLDMQQEEAQKHLQAHATQMQAQGLKATCEVRRGDPAAVILETAAARGADLLVLRTHGKAGTDAFWSGSLAPRVAARFAGNLLLVPLHGGGGS